MNKTKSIIIVTLIFCVAIVFSACKTYYIPVKSFEQQFANLDTSDLVKVTTHGPLGIKANYKTYPIEYIHAIDKKGNPVTLKNSPSIELRITDTANKRTIFYFDLIRFNGTDIIGSKSRFVPSIKKKIPIKAVKTIEVQNGRKNFRYVEKK